jgi:hypothetical protein
MKGISKTLRYPTCAWDFHHSIVWGHSPCISGRLGSGTQRPQ